MLIYQNNLALTSQAAVRVHQTNNGESDPNVSGPVAQAASHQQQLAIFVSSSLMDHRVTAKTIGLAFTLGPVFMLPMYFFEGLNTMFRGGIVCIAFLFLPISMYIGKKHLRKTLWREIRSRW